ncbi:MAG: hypothetical protein WA705_24965, partial [Candidatus Ozemobacteraceae bacterium]
VGGKFSDLTLEDALEVCLFGIAQSEHGAELFVTSDKWLIQKVQGMNPHDALKRYEMILKDR